MAIGGSFKGFLSRITRSASLPTSIDPLRFSSKIMARLVRATGAVTVAAVVTPFKYEGVRNRRADAAIIRLQREAGLMMAFFNQGWFNRYNDDTPMFDVFDALDRHIATSLYSVISRLNAPRSHSGSTFTSDRRSV